MAKSWVAVQNDFLHSTKKNKKTYNHKLNHPSVAVLHAHFSTSIHYSHVSQTIYLTIQQTVFIQKIIHLDNLKNNIKINNEFDFSSK